MTAFDLVLVDNSLSCSCSPASRLSFVRFDLTYEMLLAASCRLCAIRVLRSRRPIVCVSNCLGVGITTLFGKVMMIGGNTVAAELDGGGETTRVIGTDTAAAEEAESGGTTGVIDADTAAAEMASGSGTTG